MNPDVKTCPDCGALITPQLVRCRQCGRYLHGTKLEGLIFEHLLPESLRGAPGTGIMMLLCLVYYALMAMLAGIPNAIAFSGFSIDALGGITSWGIWQGEYWRFVTSMFAHHDLVHIAFNLYGLAVIGRLVEQIFDRKKMIIMYLVSGTASMAASYAWHTVVLGGLSFSVGASGAVCGMLGAALVGTHRMGPIGADVKKVLIRWGIYLVVWGLVVPGIDNAAHVGGFAVGAAIAYVLPLGMVQNVGTNRALSVVVLSMLGIVVFCVAQMLIALHGYPASLADDSESRGILFFNVYQGTNPAYSSQRLILQDCQELAEKDPTSDHTVQKCELAIRANPLNPYLYRLTARLHEARGERERAETLTQVAKRLARS